MLESAVLCHTTKLEESNDWEEYISLPPSNLHAQPSLPVPHDNDKLLPPRRKIRPSATLVRSFTTAKTMMSGFAPSSKRVSADSESDPSKFSAEIPEIEFWVRVGLLASFNCEAWWLFPLLSFHEETETDEVVSVIPSPSISVASSQREGP